jgi:hypothetical protein
MVAARRISAISWSSFTRRSVSITCRTSTISSGAATPVRHALAHFVQHTRDLLVPGREQPERRVQRGRSAARSGRNRSSSEIGCASSKPKISRAASGP